MTRKIILNNVSDITDIVTIASQYNQPISISSGWITANAKSILGLYSLQFGMPLELVIDGAIDEKQFEEDFNQYIMQLSA